MTVNYTLNRRDVLDLHVYAFFRTSRHFVIPLICLLVIWYLSAGEQLSAVSLPVRILTLGFMAVAFAAVLIVLYALAILAIVFLRKGDPSVLCEHAVTVREANFLEVTALNRTETSWIGIPKFARTGRHIFLFVNRTSAHIIPRRAFSSDEQWDAFYTYCQTKIRHSPAVPLTVPVTR